MRTLSELEVRRWLCEYGALAVVCLALNLGAAEAQSPLLLQGVSENHCSQIMGTPRSDLLVCQVWDGNAEQFAHPRRIEVFRKRRLLRTFEPGTVIQEWHLWDGGKAIAMHVDAPNSYALYSTVTGKLLATLSQVQRSSQLPEWAKNQAQRDDEAVPQGPRYVKQRTQWISKVLDQTQAIRPGMKRRELDALFTTEGGLSTRDHRTYVLRECRYIKIDVSFTSVSGPADPIIFSPDDVIASVSKPYLEFGHYD